MDDQDKAGSSEPAAPGPIPTPDRATETSGHDRRPALVAKILRLETLKSALLIIVNSVLWLFSLIAIPAIYTFSAYHFSNLANLYHPSRLTNPYCPSMVNKPKFAS